LQKKKDMFVRKSFKVICLNNVPVEQAMQTIGMNQNQYCKMLTYKAVYTGATVTG